MCEEEVDLLAQLEQEAFSEGFGSDWVLASEPSAEAEEASQEAGEGARSSQDFPNGDAGEGASSSSVIQEQCIVGKAVPETRQDRKAKVLSQREYERSLQDSMNRALP